MTAFCGLTQNLNDTSKISISKKDALKVLGKAYEAKALTEQRDLLLNQVDTLKARIVIKEMLITTLNGQIDNYKNIKASQESIIQTMKDQQSLLEKQITLLNKDIRKKNRRERWTAIGGVALAGLLTYLYISK
jgi:chromosome segregation ATPase